MRGPTWYTVAMRTSFGWVFVGLMACTNAGTVQDPGGPPPAPTPVATPETPTPPASTPGTVTVQMTAATLADDCGGSPPAGKAKEMSARMKGDRSDSGARSKQLACGQSSMQLSVVAAAGGAPTQLTVTKVELLDDKGAMIGELTAQTPTAWDQNGTYQPWDQSVAPGQELSVSYALSQPPWASVPDRWNRGYVLKAVFTIAGGEQSVQRDVRVSAPTILPPNVKT